jgi:hypothetical protein
VSFCSNTKASVHNKPIEKEAHLSPSDGVQSQNNPTDGLTLHHVKSVAASPQQVSLFLAQPERLEQGPEKTGSTSEVKTHQAVDCRYVRQCSLTDKSSIWSDVLLRKKILTLRY